MRYSFIMNNVGTVILIVLCICLIAAVVRRVISCRKVRKLSDSRKHQLLNELCNPLGYDYIPCQDIFVTRLDAWQRRFGYEAAYDRLAVNAGMVFDCFPVYFDYRGRTWLLEFWKGQYGISVGGEIEIYHADHIVQPEDYRRTHYEAASLKDLLGFGICLQVGSKGLLDYRKMHWWLGVFRVGRYIKPKRIKAFYRIRFFDAEMKEAFVQGLKNSGYPMEKVKEQDGCTVGIVQTTETYLRQTCIRRLQVVLTNIRNCVLNVLYHLYTIPFKSSADRILFIYFQVPFIIRRVLRIRKYKSCERRKRNGVS